ELHGRGGGGRGRGVTTPAPVTSGQSVRERRLCSGEGAKSLTGASDSAHRIASVALLRLRHLRPFAWRSRLPRPARRPAASAPGVDHTHLCDLLPVLTQRARRALTRTSSCPAPAPAAPRASCSSRGSPAWCPAWSSAPPPR